MVDIAAMFSIKPAGALGEIIGQPGVETPGIGGFNQLLALQIAGLTPDAVPAGETAPVPTVASDLPASGNILPPGFAALPVSLAALPGASPTEPPETERRDEEPSTEPAPSALPGFPALLSLPIVPLAVVTQAAAPQRALKQSVMPTAPSLDKPQVTPKAAPASAPADPAAAPRLLPVAATPPAEVTAALAISLAPLALPTTAAATFQIQVRPRTIAAAAAQSVEVSDSAPNKALTSQTGSAPPAVQPASATLDLLRPKMATAESLSVPPAPAAPAMVALPFDAAPAQNAPAVTNATPNQTPHDFAALVDRLVEARDAIRPQTVTAAISTAEFGQVALRFASDDAGLSVTMASADPEFARAAQAAQAIAVQAATVQPTAQTQSGSDASAQGQSSSARQDGFAGASGHSDQRGEGRGQQRERSAEGRADPRNPPRAEARESSRQSGGIFA